MNKRNINKITPNKTLEDLDTFVFLGLLGVALVTVTAASYEAGLKAGRKEGAKNK